MMFVKNMSRFKWVLSGVACFFVVNYCLEAAEIVAVESAKPRLGMNFYSITDWNRDIPFADIMKSARPWIPQRDGTWDTGEELSLDADGYVKELQPGQWAVTLMFTDIEGHHPVGEFIFLYEGEGEWEWSGLARLVSSEPGRQKVLVSADDSKFIMLKLKSVNPENYPRNMRFLQPGTEHTYKDNPYAADFLQRWGGVDTIRFMDWMRTNRNSQSHWSERPRPGHRTFYALGVPLELMLDLCNRTNSNAWFSLPHLADDEYIRTFARLTSELLKPELKVYLEFSNEVWNSMFAQAKWAQEKGVEAELASRPWEAGWLFYAKQCARMFDIVEEVFKDARQRCRLVVSSQAANDYVTRKILEAEDVGKRADVLAIGPYITFNVGPRARGDQPDMNTVAEWSLDQLFEHLRTVSLPRSLEWIDRHAQLAKQYNLELAAYEGGQHLTALDAARDNRKLIELLAAANHDPRMGEIYKKYFAHWQKAGGGLFCHWNATGQYGRFGCWGLLEWRTQDPATSPKYQALKEWSGALP